MLSLRTHGTHMIAVSVTPDGRTAPRDVRLPRHCHRRIERHRTRRQHRDYWQDKRDPLHHEDLADSFFAQIPPIPSGKPPSKSKSGTFSPILVCPRGHETVQHISQCCRRTSTCSQMPILWAGELPQLTPERKGPYHMPLQSAHCAPEKKSIDLLF